MADQVNKYRLWCITEESYVEGWGTEAPTVCYNNNTHTIDEDSIVQIDSVSDSDVIIKDSEITLPSQSVGFQDLTGHNVYRLGHMNYLALAGETTIFMEKFSSTMYLQGGGVDIPEYVYVSGEKSDNKPEHGDYCIFDLVDVDNVTGYTKSFDISKVARSGNVATITTSTEHSFVTDEVCCINPNDDTFDDLEVAITVVDSTHITYPNTGDDVGEKDATGKVGKILVLAPFVPQDYVYSGMTWDCMCGDAKAVPAGVYLRFRYVSVGSSNVIVMPHNKMRT